MIEKRTPAKTSGPMNKAEAQAITKRIKTAVDSLSELLVQAHDRKAWKALGYETWDKYIAGEFTISRRRSYQLLIQGDAIKQLRDAAGDLGTDVHISEAAARDIKDELPAVTAEVKARVEAGEEPQKAVADTVKAKRAEKAAKKSAKVSKPDTQPEHTTFHDQQTAALPQFVKDHQQATTERKAKAKAAQAPEERIAELEQEVAALTGEITAVKEENAKFSDMKVQFQQGGFDKVIAGKDEEIRVLRARLTQESEDKAGWVGKAKTWQKRALDLGWSSDVVIQIEEPNDEVIPLD